MHSLNAAVEILTVGTEVDLIILSDWAGEKDAPSDRLRRIFGVHVKAADTTGLLVGSEHGEFFYPWATVRSVKVVDWFDPEVNR